VLQQLVAPFFAAARFEEIDETVGREPVGDGGRHGARQTGDELDEEEAAGDRASGRRAERELRAHLCCEIEIDRNADRSEVRCPDTVEPVQRLNERRRVPRRIVRTWSLANDCRLLLQTVPIIVRGERPGY
jgi:hypothetical protein